MDIMTKVNELLGTFKKLDGLRTSDVRKASGVLFKELNDKSIVSVFGYCERMLGENEWALWLVAYDWAYRVRKQYDENTFQIFEGWLKKYVKDWSDCDDFCTHALGHLISLDNSLYGKVKLWATSDNFAMRRAAAVSLIYPINHDKYDGIDPFEVSDLLMHDEHYLVQKGYGWMLKVLSQKQPLKVIAYLERNKHIMPRTAFRYALEKLDKDTKKGLMTR